MVELGSDLDLDLDPDPWKIIRIRIRKTDSTVAANSILLRTFIYIFVIYTRLFHKTFFILHE